MVGMIGVFALGLVIGIFIAARIFKKRPIGILRVDESDPEDGPYLFLELSTNPEVIKHMKSVTLKVNVENFISQK